MFRTDWALSADNQNESSVNLLVGIWSRELHPETDSIMLPQSAAIVSLVILFIVSPD